MARRLVTSLMTSRDYGVTPQSSKLSHSEAESTAKIN